MKGWRRKDKRHSIDMSGRPPDTFLEMFKLSPTAACLYFALMEYAKARGVGEITLTRHQIANMLGLIRMATVSESLNCLARGAWIIKDVYNEMTDEGVMQREITVKFLRKFADGRSPAKTEALRRHKKPLEIATVDEPEEEPFQVDEDDGQ